MADPAAVPLPEHKYRHPLGPLLRWLEMDDPNRPKTSPVRTSRLDIEWDSADETTEVTPPIAPELDEEQTLVDNRPNRVLDVEPYTDITDDVSTDVMAPGPALDRLKALSRESVDLLLLSEEEQRLQHPRGGAGPYASPVRERSPAAPFALPAPPVKMTREALPTPVAPPEMAASLAASSIDSSERMELPPMNPLSPDVPELLPAPTTGISGAKLVLILGILLPLAAGGGIWAGMTFLQPKASAVTAPIVKTSLSRPEPAAKAPVTLIERAAAGEFKAQDELKARPPHERTSEETLALARGRAENKKLAIDGFAGKLKEKPSLLEDPKQLERLRDFLMDRETTNAAAAVIATLPGAVGPDLIYDTWVRAKGPNETTLLAEELLYSKDLNPKASPALKVALDLRKAQTCDEVLAVLPTAHQHGDKRSRHLLAKLLQKRGCGDAKKDDCYPCLRDLDDDKEKISVKDAIQAVTKRPGPKL